MERTNGIWEQADIEWQIESIVRHPLPNEDRLIASFRSRGRVSPNQLFVSIMSGRRSAGVWNVYLVQDLTAIMGMPGVYVPGVQSLISSLRDPAGEGDPGRILAHELGHSLTLPHIRCTSEGNLMSPGCAANNRVRLSADQIEAARSQADKGEALRLF